MSTKLPEATMKLLNLAEKLSASTPESGAFMLLVAAACLTSDRATYFATAQEAFETVHGEGLH